MYNMAYSMWRATIVSGLRQINVTLFQIPCNSRLTYPVRDHSVNVVRIGDHVYCGQEYGIDNNFLNSGQNNNDKLHS